jgi:hypothetical protein
MDQIVAPYSGILPHNREALDMVTVVNSVASTNIGAKPTPRTYIVGCRVGFDYPAFPMITKPLTINELSLETVSHQMGLAWERYWHDLDMRKFKVPDELFVMEGEYPQYLPFLVDYNSAMTPGVQRFDSHQEFQLWCNLTKSVQQSEVQQVTEALNRMQVEQQ